MASKLVISNTTPLLNFAQIGRLDLVYRLFGQVVIPAAVASELAAKPVLFPEAAKVPLCADIVHMVPADSLLVGSLARQVHQGEAECLALAMEHPGALLLLDDLAAREIAGANRLHFTGTLGCLMMAKQRGLLTHIRPLLADLKEKARFWLSAELGDRVLREVGEL